MNSTRVLQLINEIAATPGKNDKAAMVAGGMTTPLFKQVCEYAYNPFKTYGIRQIPERLFGDGGVKNFDDATWQVLDDLISRKLTGNAAREAVQCEIDALYPDGSSDLFVRIIRKDLRAGFSESTINKACKTLIPEFPYMRCSLPKDAKLETWPWADGVISQEKADGMFANVDHELNGLVSIRSRQGSEFPMEKFEAVANEIRNRLTPGFQQHGEFLVMRDGKVLPRAESNGVMDRILSGGDFAENERPIYMIWDQIPLTSVVKKGKCATKYKARLGSIITQLRAESMKPDNSVMLIPTRIVKSLAEGYAHAVELMKLGKEGTVIKHPDMPWKDGTSNEQVKLKLEFVVDLEITGIVPGRAGTKNEGRPGSLSCKTSCGGIVVDVTVKNDAMRAQIEANPEDWIGRIIAVTANDITLPSDSNDKHSLFLPRMVEAAYRTDKSVSDTLQRVFDQKEAAIFGESLLKEAA